MTPARDIKRPNGAIASASLEAAPTEATRWLVPELTTLPIAARRCVVRSTLDGAALELSSGEHAVLSACEGWRTLADHAEHAAARLGAPAEHKRAIHELLGRCARAGLLRALPELVQRFGAPDARAPAPLTAVLIRTADRPQLLRRLLASAAALEARSGQRYWWIVVDDSHQPGNELANRAVIDACRVLEVEHIDRAESSALENALRAEFPSFAHEIAWLLAPGAAHEATPGRPLNYGLLRLAGRAFVSLDDDAQLEARRPGLSEAGFAVSDEQDEFLWYESEEALWHACGPLALDPIKAHGQWLGLPLADAWMRAEQEAGDLALMRIPATELRRFEASARVLFTHNHACGDPGSSLLPTQLLTLPERTRLWLEANPQAANRAFGWRIGWRGQARLRLAPQRLLTLTTMAGIDNSRLLPPAARVHRSQDIVFGMAAQSMYPTSWVVDLPFGLPHLRVPAKHWLGCSERFQQEPLQVICAYLDEHAPRVAAESPAERLAALSAMLLDLAAASDRDLAQMLSQHAADMGSRALFAIQEQLDSPTLPAAWKAALAPWLRSPALALGPEALGARVLEPGRMRALLLEYGRVMQAWPQLWEFCRQRHR